jgi:hypothetical protein
MAHWKRLTGTDGDQIDVNMDAVAYLQEFKDHTAIQRAELKQTLRAIASAGGSRKRIRPCRTGRPCERSVGQRDRRHVRRERTKSRCCTPHRRPAAWAGPRYPCRSAAARTCSTSDRWRRPIGSATPPATDVRASEVRMNRSMHKFSRPCSFGHAVYRFHLAGKRRRDAPQRYRESSFRAIFGLERDLFDLSGFQPRQQIGEQRACDGRGRSCHEPVLHEQALVLVHARSPQGT